MKLRHYYILFILSLGIVSSMFAETVIQDKTYELNLVIPSNWTRTRQTRKIHSFQHENKVTSFNVRVIQYLNKYPTANGLQERRSGIVYDGWLNMLEREGAQEENLKSNTTESSVAVYSKKELNKQFHY